MYKKRPFGRFFIISGGGRQFYGQLHTTTGNLQGNFAIFAIKINLHHAQVAHSLASTKYSLNK